MESEVEIEVYFEIDLTGRADKVNAKVGVNLKLILSLVLCNLVNYFWQGICTCLLWAGKVDIPC